MFSVLRVARPARVLVNSRSLAYTVSRRAEASTEILAPPPPQKAARPHYGVPVQPDHGLWAFFRKKEGNDGNPKYITLEPPTESATGRSWTAAELRRKSFKDLHTLWYIVLRERNLLDTQAEEARRLGIQHTGLLTFMRKKHSCRKTMARIKYVLNERRIAYEGSLRVLKEKKAELSVPTKYRQSPRSDLRTKIVTAGIKSGSSRRGMAVRRRFSAQKYMTAKSLRRFKRATASRIDGARPEERVKARWSRTARRQAASKVAAGIFNKKTLASSQISP